MLRFGYATAVKKRHLAAQTAFASVRTQHGHIRQHALFSGNTFQASSESYALNFAATLDSGQRCRASSTAGISALNLRGSHVSVTDVERQLLNSSAKVHLVDASWIQFAVRFCKLRVCVCKEHSDSSVATLPNKSMAQFSDSYVARHSSAGSQRAERSLTDRNRFFNGLPQLFVHELAVPGVRSLEGEPLLHTFAYYTLNRIPKP